MKTIKTIADEKMEADLMAAYRGETPSVIRSFGNGLLWGFVNTSTILGAIIIALSFGLSIFTGIAAIINKFKK